MKLEPKVVDLNLPYWLADEVEFVAKNDLKLKPLSAERILENERKLEAYNDIQEAGCFYCGTWLNDQQADPQCVDTCSENGLFPSDMYEIFKEDDPCGEVIMQGTFGLRKYDLLDGPDTALFADSLIFDDRISTCYSFDPRDDHRRRLQAISDADCRAMDCFDCAHTGGSCIWDSNSQECMQKPRDAQFEGVR